MRTILYNEIASSYVPAPRSCHARVVINGESWGIYILQEEFDGDFLEDRFGTRKGVRWKVSGDGGDGTFAYRGENPDAYRMTFELKTSIGRGRMAGLIELCRILDRTPVKQLEEALARRLDIDETLWFLALDNALMNCDGYWVPTGDFDLYLDEEGRFHLIPRDANEAFREPGGMIAGGVQVGGRTRSALRNRRSEEAAHQPAPRATRSQGSICGARADDRRGVARSREAPAAHREAPGTHRERRLGRPAEAGWVRGLRARRRGPGPGGRTARAQAG